MDMNQPDYDGRTALHVAAAEGQIQVVEFLLDRCQCSPFLVDRWGFTALDDAKRFQKQETAALLQSHMFQQNPDYFRDKDTSASSSHTQSQEEDADLEDDDSNRQRTEPSK